MTPGLASPAVTAPEPLAMPPALAMPPRPERPLSIWQLIKSRGTNSLALCDEGLFEELVVERRLLWRKVFVVCDPEGLRRVLIDNGDNYHVHRLKRRQLEPGLGSGVLINNGALWRRHRALLNPTLDHRAILPDAPALIRWTEILADHLADWPAGEPINIGHAMSVLLAVSAGHIFAGAEDEATVRPMLIRMGKYPGRRRMTDYLPISDWLRWRSRQIRAEAQQWYPLIDRLIAERTRPDYAGGKDFVWRLVHTSTREGDRLTHQEIRDEVLTLAVGAIETTLRPICWLWYLLALHPWAEERLHAELDRVLGERSLAVEDVPKLAYLRQVVDETMRLYPPVPVILRQAMAADTVCGHAVPPNSVIVIAPWIIHRHRRLWHDPDSFDPDRFLPENISARSRYAYMPFSVGPRTCIAAPMAMLQVQIAAAVLARRFRFRLVPTHPVEPTGWNTLRPEHGIMVTVERRPGAR
ncbi:MAG: cytochrome P450 [Alphaproteobacteria bacterium]|nr:cytochrome P450 [Alphaproteobacteria bacterium]